MTQVIQALLITLGLDSKGVGQGMKQAENQVRQGVQTISRFIAPLVGAFSLAQMWQSYAGDARKLGELSRLTGESVRELDAWGQAAKRMGGSAENMQNAMAGLSAKLRDSPVEVRRWGLEAQNASGVMSELASLSERVSERRFFQIGKSLGFDERTIVFLRQGRQEVGKLVGDMRKVSLSTQDAESMRKFDRSLHDFALSFRELAGTLMRFALPAIQAVVAGLNGLFKLARENPKLAAAGIGLLATVLTAKLVPAMGAVVWGFAKMGAAMLLNPLTWVVGALGLLALVLEDLYTYTQGGESALEDLWKTFGTGAEVGKQIGDALKTVLPYLKWLGVYFVASKASGGVGAWVRGLSLAPGIIAKLTGAVKALGMVIRLNPLGLLITGVAALIAYNDELDAFIDSYLKLQDSKTEGGNTTVKTRDTEGNITGEVALPSFFTEIKGPGAGPGVAAGRSLDNAKNLLGGIAGADRSARDFGAGYAAAQPTPEAAATLAGGGNVSNQINNDTQVRIDSVTISTQAANATEMAQNAGPALQDAMRRNLVNNTSSGVR